MSIDIPQKAGQTRKKREQTHRPSQAAPTASAIASHHRRSPQLQTPVHHPASALPRPLPQYLPTIWMLYKPNCQQLYDRQIDLPRWFSNRAGNVLPASCIEQSVNILVSDRKISDDYRILCAGSRSTHPNVVAPAKADVSY